MQAELIISVADTPEVSIFDGETIRLAELSGWQTRDAELNVSLEENDEPAGYRRAFFRYIGQPAFRADGTVD